MESNGQKGAKATIDDREATSTDNAKSPEASLESDPDNLKKPLTSLEPDPHPTTSADNAKSSEATPEPDPHPTTSADNAKSSEATPEPDPHSTTSADNGKLSEASPEPEPHITSAENAESPEAFPGGSLLILDMESTPDPRAIMAPKNMPLGTSEDLYKFPYMKPEKRSCWLSFYDPETHTVFGRTFRNWASLAFFYSVFFAALGAMFSICMYGLMSTIDYSKPTYQLDASLIGSNPGLGFRPYSNDVEHTGSLIWFDAKNNENIASWTGVLDDFLHEYERAGTENRVICDVDLPPPPGKVCGVPLDSFGPCTKENGYSYNQSSPCVFIKLNRIFNWVPEYYNDSEHLPEDMDSDLKSHIQTVAPQARNIVWLSCYGENVADKEVIGPIKYYPDRGFPGQYYPFTNSYGYLSPLVAVHFERPAVNTLINIECRAWAKNIIYARSLQTREGSVHFEIQID